jgi:hypothetical protein
MWCDHDSFIAQDKIYPWAGSAQNKTDEFYWSFT